MATNTMKNPGLKFLIAVFAVLLFLMARTFLNTILWAAILAVLMFPLYKRLLDESRHRTASAFLTVIAFVLLVLIPVLIVTLMALSQWQNYSPQIISSVRSFIDQYISANIERFGIEINLADQLGNISNAVISFIRGTLGNVPAFAFKVFMVLFLLFYFLRDHKTVLREVKAFLPLSKHDEDFLFKNIKDTTQAVVYGRVLTAAIQSFIALIAFILLGLPAPMFLGLLSFIMSLIPVLGAFVVYIPLAVGLIVTGSTIKGIILLTVGLVIISSVDNIVPPKVIGDKVKMHTAVSLLALVTGLALFGFVGLIIGPVIVQIFMALLQIYRENT